MLARIILAATLIALSKSASIEKRQTAIAVPISQPITNNNCQTISLPASVKISFCGCADKSCPACPCATNGLTPPSGAGEKPQDVQKVSGGEAGVPVDPADGGAVPELPEPEVPVAKPLTGQSCSGCSCSCAGVRPSPFPDYPNNYFLNLALDQLRG